MGKLPFSAFDTLGFKQDEKPLYYFNFTGEEPILTDALRKRLSNNNFSRAKPQE